MPRIDHENPRPFLPPPVAVLCAAAAVASLTFAAGMAPAASPQGALSDPSRPAAEVARDAGSKPLQVYEWLGIRAGMTVGDIIPSAGYNTHILARVVGPQGQVLAVGANEQGKARLEQRFQDAGIANVQVFTTFADVPSDSVDVFVCVRNVHDMLIPAVAERYGMAPDPVLGGAFRALKPGGIFGVVDARTDKEGVDGSTHRVNQQTVIDALESYGFELVDSSELLANPSDDHTQASFEGDGRFTLDRMLLKFRKPAMMRR